MIKWNNKGLIFNSEGKYDWSKSYATGPVVDVIDNNIWRIYYTTRDDKNRSRPSYIEVEANNPKNILYIHNKPLLDVGKIGTFDDCGISVLSILNFNGKKYMYYLGWTVRNTISYHNSLGLAISDDGGKNFKKFSEGPILNSTYQEPYGNGASYTMIDSGVWRLWYTSVIKWEIYDDHPEPLYNIKYAESKNGIDWKREQIISIDFIDQKNKGGIARPCVIKEGEIYKMWYSYRSAYDYRTNKKNSYRIGYAESLDGKIFTRMDNEMKLSISSEGWDSIMIAYPYVIRFNDKYWIFYNGNSFGKSGFGYAEEIVKGEFNE
jgi:hypothetical protein